MGEPQLDIARNIEALDSLKADLAGFQADLYRAMLKGETEETLQALAKMIITCYLLTKRLGLNFGHLEKEVYNITELISQENNFIEEWFGDISALKEYWELKR